MKLVRGVRVQLPRYSLWSLLVGLTAAACLAALLQTAGARQAALATLLIVVGFAILGAPLALYFVARDNLRLSRMHSVLVMCSGSSCVMLLLLAVSTLVMGRLRFNAPMLVLMAFWLLQSPIIVVDLFWNRRQ